MKGIDLSLVLACYNESPIIADSLRRICDVLDMTRYSYELIFVDDGSSDTTVQIIQAFAKRKHGAHCEVKTLFHHRNYGRGKTVADGFGIARGIVVGYIDIDLEVSPVYVPQIVAEIESGKADAIIGKRIYRTTITSLIREVVSIGYQKLAQVLVRTDGIDTESGFKFFRRTKIMPVLPLAMHPHWFWDTEIIVYALRAKLRILELPVLFLRRTDKKSSVHLVRDISDYLINLWRFHERLNPQ